MSRYSLAVFDLDGTITDSSRGIFDSLKYMLSRFGKTARDEELYCCIGPDIRTVVKNLLGDDVPVEEGVAAYREYFTVKGMYSDVPIDGVPQLLMRLKDTGLKLGVATFKPEVYAKEILRNIGLSDCFDIIRGTPLDRADSDKSQFITDCRAAVGADASRTAMIGDRKFDLQSANGAGVDGIGALYGFGSREELSACPHVLLAETPAEVGDFLLG